jgi:FKBP-type peptidyl-prolyl cis-trans isomerase (trigger factor)
VKSGAERAVLADLALRAVVTQEEISVTDSEVDTEIERLAERANEKVSRVRRELERSGALETVRSDVARGKALEFLVEHATVVDENGNEIDLSLDDLKNEQADEDANEEADEDASAPHASEEENEEPET